MKGLNICYKNSPQRIECARFFFGSHLKDAIVVRQIAVSAVQVPPEECPPRTTTRRLLEDAICVLAEMSSL
jgi:hypothetical protein